jgi:hypothetical protein
LGVCRVLKSFLLFQGERPAKLRMTAREHYTFAAAEIKARLFFFCSSSARGQSPPGTAAVTRVLSDYGQDISTHQNMFGCTLK